MSENVNIAATGAASKIDEAFDKLMNQSEVKIEDPAKPLTEEQVKKISDSIENVVDGDTQKIIDSLPSNNGVEQAPYNVLADVGKGSDQSVTAAVSINPVTGVSQVDHIIPDEENEDDIPEANLDDYLDMTAYETDKMNLDNITISDSIRKEYDLSDQDVVHLMSLLKRVQKKEEFSYYNELPEGLKKFCKAVAIMEPECNGIVTKQMLNTIALNALNTLLNEIAADEFVADISDVIDTEIKKSGADLSAIYEGMIIGKSEKLREAADKAVEEGHEDTAATLRKMADACEESYMMTGFADAVKNHKLKIRKIDIEKPQKVVRDFNTKYENSKIAINNVWDLTYCIPRHLAEASTPPSPDKITTDTISAFVVAFCQYCRNMKNTNVEEHIFMYYFIKNILYLDTTAPGAEFSKFGQELIDRIKEILETIHEVYGY